MASVVEIVNRALTKLGERRIISLSDPGRAAGEAASMYELVRNAELSDHVWVFAVSRRLLPALAEPKLPGVSYAYNLPDDCLRVIGVGAVGQDLGGPDGRWTLEGRLIVSEREPPLMIRYIKRETDSALYPSSFAEALASRLAVELAEALTGSTSKKEAVSKDYFQAIKRAKRINAIQNPSQALPENSWLMARIY